MPNPNSVSVTVDTSDPANPVVTCTTGSLDVSRGGGQGNVPITFTCDTAGWQFPAGTPTAGEMYGISIAGNSSGEFSSPTRSGNGQQVVIQDADDNNTSYTYTVQVVNPATGQTAGVDPTINNQK
jgi:hypothetical protein